MKIFDMIPPPTKRRTKDDPTKAEQKVFNAYIAEYNRVYGTYIEMLCYDAMSKFATFDIGGRGLLKQTMTAKRCKELLRMMKEKEGVL